MPHPIQLYQLLRQSSLNIILSPTLYIFFFFNDTATTEIYTLSLHDALPIYDRAHRQLVGRKGGWISMLCRRKQQSIEIDRKSTRLNSSHLVISYAVFCLKKKNYLKLNIRY